MPHVQGKWGPRKVGSLGCIDALLWQELEAAPLDGLLHEQHCYEEAEQLPAQPREPACKISCMSCDAFVDIIGHCM